MDLIEIQKQLQIEVKQLNKALNTIKERSHIKTQTHALYAKELAKTIISLRNGIEFKIEDQTIKNPPASVLEKIAKGICWESQLNMEQSEISYKNCLTGIQIIQTKITALQSMNKFIDKT